LPQGYIESFNQFSDLMQQIILKLKEQVGFVNSKNYVLLTIDVQISSQEALGQ
jgi:hypothetical protein